jgi:hypothetical protein
VRPPAFTGAPVIRGPYQGITKYQHLLDGNARELKIADYGFTSPVNFLITLRKVARDRGLTFRTSVVDDKTVAFQITGSTAAPR